MKIKLLIVNLVLMTMFVSAQNGLERILVEKYYISDANDTMANGDGGVLPIGSVTYRIYVDMLPGYKFEAAYGVPGHELRIATTTLFFNNEDRGATTPVYSKIHASHNTVMLDSWLSVGAACDGNYGILKTADNGIATVINTYSPQVLQNANPLAGIPLTTQDGLIAGTPEPVTIVGITSEIAVFDNQNDGSNGPVFSTTNGSWASLYGSYGPDTVDNKVLIAQITTNGVLSFELNIQIGTPTGGVQNYVAQNPVGNEIHLPSLSYNSSTTNILSPATTSGPVFKIYPNPVKDILTMEIYSQNERSTNSFAVYDEKGCMLVNKKLKSLCDFQLEHIDLSFLSSGQYFIELTSGGISSAKKIIKD